VASATASPDPAASAPFSRADPCETTTSTRARIRIQRTKALIKSQKPNRWRNQSVISNHTHAPEARRGLRRLWWCRRRPPLQRTIEQKKKVREIKQSKRAGGERVRTEANETTGVYVWRYAPAPMKRAALRPACAIAIANR